MSVKKEYHKTISYYTTLIKKSLEGEILDTKHPFVYNNGKNQSLGKDKLIPKVFGDYSGDVFDDLTDDLVKLSAITKDFGRLLFDDFLNSNLEEKDFPQNDQNWLLLHSYAQTSLNLDEFQGLFEVELRDNSNNYIGLDTVTTSNLYNRTRDGEIQVTKCKIKSYSSHYKWQPHYDFYYIRGHLYDMLPALYEGEVIEKQINASYLSLVSVMQEYAKKYDKNKTTYQRRATSYNSTHGPTGGDWTYDPETNAYYNSMGTKYTGNVGIKTGPIMFWEDQASNFKKDCQNAKIFSDLKAIYNKTKNMCSLICSEIKPFFEEYGRRQSYAINFTSLVRDVANEQAKSLDTVWSDIDERGFKYFNAQSDSSKDMGNVALGYHYYRRGLRVFNLIYKEREKIQLETEIELTDNDREIISNKLITNEILCDMDYWNKIWKWYKQVVDYRDNVLNDYPNV